MELKELAQQFKTVLKDIYEEEEANAMFLLAIERVLNYGRSDYLLKKTEKISSQQLYQLEDILQALLTGKPIQYVLEEAYFYGLRFKVDTSVLIPRPETEELVDWILSVTQAKINQSAIHILDIGTGSGCIAIALKKHLPQAQVQALDIAQDSLELAQENALHNEVAIMFIHDDILNPQADTLKLQPSIIVSNPPYIKEIEKVDMHANVLVHEPHRALFVSNENPLLFYEAIAEFALKTLSQQGLLFFEINANLGKETIDLLAHKGFINIELRKDMQGKDRMICCIRP